MRAGWNAALEARVRRPDATARIMVDARLEGATDLRQRYDQFLNLDALPANAELITGDGAGVRLKATGAAGPGSIVRTATARDAASGAANPIIDPFRKDARRHLAALVEWGGTESPQYELTQVQAWLNPRVNAALPNIVASWRLELFAVVGTDAADQGYLHLQPIATAVAEAVGEAAGWVTFDFTAQTARPRPKSYGRPVTYHQFPAIPIKPVPYTLAIVTGLDAQGNGATNIGWDYDNTHASAGAGNVLYGLDIVWNNLGGHLSPSWVGTNTPLVNEVPAIQFTGPTHTAATIGFTGAGNKIVLPGGVPPSPPEFTLLAEVPPGCAVTGQVSADNVNFYPYTHGQTADKVGPGLPTQATWYMKWTLTQNAAGDRTPIFREGGARVVTSQDVSDLCFVESLSSGLDPVTMISETPELVLRAIRDGERDFADALTQLLSQNPIGKLTFRTWVGDVTLPRAQWCMQDDWLIDDTLDSGDGLRIYCVHPMALLRGGLPVLSAEVQEVPSADASNPGGWGASAGANLWQSIADGGFGPKHSTYILSPTTPANLNKQYTATLAATMGAPAASVPVQVQFYYQTDAGGQSVHLTVDLVEGAATVRATTTIVAAAASPLLATITLTAAQIAAIGNWGTLSLRFSSGVGGDNGAVRVTWARLVQLGIRPPLQYSNQTPATIAADLLGTQIALDGRYRGPTIIDPTPAITISKTISMKRGGSTELTQAKQELDAIANIAGGFWGPFQGRIGWRPLFDLVTDALGNVAYNPRTSLPPVATIESSELIEPINVTPGLRQRVPEYDQNWGFDEISGIYQGEAHGVSNAAVINLGDARIDAVRRANDVLASWVATQGVANGLAARQVQTIGLGLMLWRFRTQYARPELELGDPISLQTDRFTIYDPILARALFGMQWATAIVVGIYDEWGRDLAVWVPLLSSITGRSSALLPGQPPAPNPATVTVQVALKDLAGGRVMVSYSGSAGCQSVKVASSTSSFPAAGTGSVIPGNAANPIVGPFAYTDTIFVTVTPYATPDGSGVAGAAVQMKLALGADPGYVLFTGGLANDGFLNPAQVAPAAAAQENDLILNGYFEQGTTNWRASNGGVLDTSVSLPIQGTRSAVITLVAATTHRIQQVDRGTDAVNPTTGNPVYIPVQALDEVYGSIKWNGPAGIDTVKFGFEEYDASKALIQRTYLDASNPPGGVQTKRNGVVLQATTAYIVAIVEYIAGAGSTGLLFKFDDFHLYRVPLRRRCRVWLTANQGINNAAATAVNFTSEDYDLGALHDTAAATSKIVIPADFPKVGVLLLHGQVSFDPASAVGSRQIQIKKNGATFVAGGYAPATTTGAGDLDCSCVIQCNTLVPGTDYFELIVTQNSGGALNAQAGADKTFFEALHIV